jgi:hypothetical protein
MKRGNFRSSTNYASIRRPRLQYRIKLYRKKAFKKVGRNFLVTEKAENYSEIMCELIS